MVLLVILVLLVLLVSLVQLVQLVVLVNPLRQSGLLRQAAAWRAARREGEKIKVKREKAESRDQSLLRTPNHQPGESDDP
jgi:hypothetical protein